MLVFFIILAILVSLNVFLGIPVLWVSLIGIGIFCFIIFMMSEASKEKIQEKLEILKRKMKEKNEEFEPTKIIEINTASADISMDFLINEKKEKFAISYCDASESTKKIAELIKAKMQEEKTIVNSSSEDKAKLLNQVKNKYEELINQVKNQSVEDLCKLIEYNFDDLIDYELLESTETKLQGKMLSAAGGALLLGGVGALIGMSGEKKVKKNKEFIVVNLQLDDINCPIFPIEFYNCKELAEEKYEERLENAKELCSMLLYIKNRSHKKFINNSIENETEHFSELEQLEKPAINTKVYSFIFNVIGIRGEERLDAFFALADETEIYLNIDGGFEKKVWVDTDNGIIGYLNKNDTEKCFQAIADICEADLNTIFTWTINHSVELVLYDNENNKCKIKVEFWHEDFDRDSEELEQENIEVEKSCEEYDNKKTVEDNFNWELWHSLYNNCSKINFALAGISYKNEDGIDRKSIINELPTYFPVSFIKEPNNSFDKNAIAVYSINGKIGYVPKSSIVDVNRILNKITCIRGKKHNQYVVIDVLFM
ncbi:HIRAN domain-containing protein [Thomasclavelia cocleata]|uniref:HIRAN domain-containing protein n=1 Tax=Thomasclavelia cocleata TaxID=69824 RepID=UPI000E961D9F|nr:HIRAN domain-containing protein [Thomasclavelia cocleata]HBV41716.1 hypothetical protein [Desulfovibrio sp.]